MIHRLFNTGLRLASLGLKLILTLYMGKYLGLAEIGTYGLVSAFVMISMTFVGMRLDYVVTREIVGADPVETTTKIRDEAAFLLMNYVLLGVVVLGLYISPYDSFDDKILLYTFALSVLESFVAIVSGNLVPMGRPILSTALFFIRSASWVPIVVVVGFLYPEYRTAEFIFACWLGGIVLNVIINALVWKGLPWKDVFAKPVDKKWLIVSLKCCFFIWLGSVASSCSANIDRFVTEFYLGREAVGVVSFYASFVASVSALMASGVFTFSYPVLIRLYKEKKRAEFWEETKKATTHATLFAALICAAMGLIIPYFGVLVDRPELSDYAPVFWMLLFSVWIKTATEILYYVQYAWGEDRILWQTNFAYLGLTLLTNIIFIHFYGMMGIGYAAIITAIFLCFWRIYWVKRLGVKHR